MTIEDFANGFQTALDKLEDILVDIPQAGDMLAKFIARAIVDEVIPPSFLKNAWADTKECKEVLASAHGLITDSHRSRKLEHIWGPGDLESVKRLKAEVSKIVEEYLTTGDKVEADSCVRRLNAPSFHFQLVRQALRMALSANEDNRKKILELLRFFHKEGLVVADHVTQGFKACESDLPDMKLDIPTAPTTFQNVVKIAQDEKWLAADFK